jgi:uncharacterized protein
MNILITGGTGLIGTELTKKLLANGHKVRFLSRKKTKIDNVEVFEYDYTKNYLEKGALDGIEVLVHLAGAGIADKRWSENRKKELIDSRTKTLEVIQNNLGSHNLTTIIGGSAIGFYGGDTGEITNNETTNNGSDFLANCTQLWEKAEDDFASKNKLRSVIIRTGVVLSNNGGALPKLILPIKLNVGTAFGSGKQWISWIHIDDLVEFFFEAITNNLATGIWNGVAQKPETNDDFNKIAAKVLNKFYFLPKVPAFMLKLVLGEMSTVVLGSCKVKNKQLLPVNIKYKTLDLALEELLLK